MSIVDIKVPSVGESITEVTIKELTKKNGDIIAQDDIICVIESDKANQELPAEASGKIEWLINEGDNVTIGSLIARIDTSATAQKQTAAPKTNAVAPPQAIETTATPATGHPSPAAAKILREQNIAPETLQGTGKDGRITKEDAQKATTEPKKIETPIPQAAAQVQDTAATFSRNVRREKMSRMRRTIATRLVSAKNNTAMLTTFNEVDMTEIMAFRKKYQDRFVAKYGIKLGFMSLFAKACAKVLLEMPEVNAMIDGTDLIYHDYADISIAVSTPTGLVVPPVHNVESLKLHEIEFKIKDLADKARLGKLTLDEMKGGTFTITNGGVFGSMMSTPIINEPQSAILGMHNVIERPVAINGEVKIRPMMYVALSYDHRVMDGSSSVLFVVKVKNLLEDPVSLLLDI